MSFKGVSLKEAVEIAHKAHTNPIDKNLCCKVGLWVFFAQIWAHTSGVILAVSFCLSIQHVNWQVGYWVVGTFSKPHVENTPNMASGLSAGCRLG